MTAETVCGVHPVLEVLQAERRPIEVVKSCRRRRITGVKHRVVFGSREVVDSRLAKYGWKMNTAFVERLNLDVRQHVAAIGRRVKTLCKHEAGLRQQLAIFHAYHNFVLPHASLRLPVLRKNICVISINHLVTRWLSSLRDLT